MKLFCDAARISVGYKQDHRRALTSRLELGSCCPKDACIYSHNHKASVVLHVWGLMTQTCCSHTNKADEVFSLGCFLIPDLNYQPLTGRETSRWVQCWITCGHHNKSHSSHVATGYLWCDCVLSYQHHDLWERGTKTAHHLALAHKAR